MVTIFKEAERPPHVVIETPNNPPRVEDILKSRKTYRLFLDKPVEEWKKRELLNIFNSPTFIETDYGDLRKFWSYKVVEDRPTRERIFDEVVFSRRVGAIKSAAYEEMLNAPIIVAIWIDTNEVNKYKNEKLDTFHKGIPHTFWLASADISDKCTMAGALAHELGLSAWWIGQIKGTKLKEILNLPEGSLPHHIFVFGYPRTDEKEGKILEAAGKSFPRAPPPERFFSLERYGVPFPGIEKSDFRKSILIRKNEIPQFKTWIEKQLAELSVKANDGEKREMDKIKGEIFKLIDADKPGLNEKVNEQLQELYAIVKEVRERKT